VDGLPLEFNFGLCVNGSERNAQNNLIGFSFLNGLRTPWLHLRSANSSQEHFSVEFYHFDLFSATSTQRTQCPRLALSRVNV